ncbi:MAG TPA: hypothetical protein VFU15_06140, partial [Bacteroidia bacterium]|nr:hypothetical protein [Bacteroidia bacterium]
NSNFSKRKFYYTIYYQDDSYKFPEYSEAGGMKYENRLSSRNFYGSWGETEESFRPTKELAWGEQTTVTDSFRIVGNPRNEPACFGRMDQSGISALKIANMINYIHTRADWMLDVQVKAGRNHCTIEQQVFRDAVWQIDDQRKKKEGNNRWKRNPRAGTYKFMLVVTTYDALQDVPVSVRDLTKSEPNGHAINPFYFFLYGTGSVDKRMKVLVADEQLSVKVKFETSSGVYADPFQLTETGIDTSSFCATCGTDSLLYRRAQFEQLNYFEDHSNVLNTIPVTADVADSNYTRAQYEANKEKYADENSRVQDIVRNFRRPCETVKVDSATGAIELINPGNPAPPYRKENVGVRSRIGLTYGKYRVCVAFPKIISQDHVWNGICNAVWLLYQDDAPWNARKDCAGGYIAKSDNRKKQAERQPTLNYSEIDMEMVKASGNWPASSYGKNPAPADDHPENNDDVLLACTNWDMACHEPKKYVEGVVPLFFRKRKFDLHRWDYWYQAVTIRTVFDHNEIFNRPYYWYGIDWTPDHITWSVGPDKDHMTVIGYMDDSVTAIPDNQMSLVVTQQFHNTEWWVPAPFDQRYIPYPKHPIVGRVLAVEVE